MCRAQCTFSVTSRGTASEEETRGVCRAQCTFSVTHAGCPLRPYLGPGVTYPTPCVEPVEGTALPKGLASRVVPGTTAETDRDRAW